MSPNRAASVRARLLNWSKQEKHEFQRVLNAAELGGREHADALSEPHGVDGSDLFAQHPRPLTVNDDLGPKRGRARRG